jgi:hypothetical protein
MAEAEAMRRHVTSSLQCVDAIREKHPQYFQSG